MANLIIRVTGIGAVGDQSQLSITGEARTDDMRKENPSVYWEATVNIADPLMNVRIGDAAIAAVLQAGFIVGLLDLKTIIGSPSKI